jgi:acyl-CoA oxidase
MFRYARYEGDNYVLDEQVVRAALKSYRILLSDKDPSDAFLSPSSYYLRLLVKGSPPSFTDSSWKDPAVAVLLLEWRATLIVQDLARNQGNPDASANQRASKAVTEAFVATQIVQLIRDLPLTDKDKIVVGDLYRLVSELAFADAYSGAKVTS